MERFFRFAPPPPTGATEQATAIALAHLDQEVFAGAMAGTTTGAAVDRYYWTLWDIFAGIPSSSAVTIARMVGVDSLGSSADIHSRLWSRTESGLAR